MQKLKIGEIDGVTCPSNNPPSIVLFSAVLWLGLGQQTVQALSVGTMFC